VSSSGTVSEVGFSFNFRPFIFSPPGPRVLVPSTTSGSSVVLGFSADHPCCKQYAGWTASRGTVSLAFDAAYFIPVKAWVIHRTAAVVSRINGDVMYTNTALEQERTGLQIRCDIVQLYDATDEPADLGCPDFETLQRHGDVDPDALNVYYLEGNSVGPENGAYCPGELGTNPPVIVMNADAGPDLLLHELSHHFHGPVHAEDIGGANMDEKNYMSGSSDTRQYITEGQTALAQFCSSSCLNAYFSMRPAGECAYCESYVDWLPNIQMTIWDELH
jgi:hypothetical protein